MNRILLLCLVASLGADVCQAQLAQAQLTLPGAALPDPSAAPAKPPSVKKRPKAMTREPGLASIVDRPLLLNGLEGELRLSGGGKDKKLHVEKFTLPGEVVSDPSQKCRIDIVAQTPIEAVSQGEPDGLPRYSADIPACPLTFDVLNGAVLVPAQTSTCVFQAADCQASPSGLWGPASAEMQDKDDKTIARERSRAEASITASSRTLAKRDKGASLALSREQNDYASLREDVCRDYSGEAKHGYCATRLTQARAALLSKRAEAGKRKADDADN